MLQESPVENHHPIKAIIIGAGYSGIYCALRLSQRIRNLELTVYEKNPTFGGTWFVNKYPGCAVDVPTHSYQYSFAPNPAWSGFNAPAPEIQAYLEGVARKYSVDRFTEFQHEVKTCAWDQGDKKWKLEVEDLTTCQVKHDEANVLIMARGLLSNPAWPDIPGLDQFKGKVVHSALWDESYDFSNKRIGVIGSGSSAIQIVPQLQKLPGTQLSCFVRSKVWISAPFGDSALEKLGRDTDVFTPKELAHFTTDPAAYRAVRKLIETEGNSIHALTLRDSSASAHFRALFTSHMRDVLSSKPPLADQLLPSFAPGCRRLSPGPGYLEALTQPNVTLLSSPITHMTPTSIHLADGTSHPLDVLVCATGFHTSAGPPFPVTGKHGTDLSSRFEPFPESYLSVAVDGFPNYFTMNGPNSAIGTGSLTMIIESVGDYIVKCARKLQKEGIASMEVRPERVRDFSRYCEEYFRRTIYFDACRTWYKKRVGGEERVTGLWPGSTLHAIEALRSPRWEDWEYEYDEEGEGESKDGGGVRNRLSWLGNGWSMLQLEEGRDLAYYLEPEFVDVPAEPLPEETRRYQLQPFSH